MKETSKKIILSPSGASLRIGCRARLLLSAIAASTFAMSSPAAQSDSASAQDIEYIEEKIYGILETLDHGNDVVFGAANTSIKVYPAGGSAVATYRPGSVVAGAKPHNIDIFIEPMVAVHPEFDPRDLDSYEWALMEMALRHELMHACCGHGPMSGVNAKNSCAHYKINYFSAKYACNEACQIASMPEPTPSDLARQKALCDWIKKLSDYWNEGKGSSQPPEALKKKACQCATGVAQNPDLCNDRKCGQNKPVAAPPGRSGSAYGDWKPIPTCECCP